MMDDKKGIGRIPLSVGIGLSVVILASGGAAAWFTWRTLNPRPAVVEFPSLDPPTEPVPSIPEVPTTDTPQTPSPAPDVATTADTAQVFWVTDADGRLVLTPQSISLPADASATAKLEAAFDTLLQGAESEGEGVSTIPAGTTLRQLSVEGDGIHVDLSAEFQQGGGSFSMRGRLGQIIYTATGLDPDAPVWISVQGEPLTLLGGEGLEVEQPMTRESYQTAFGG